MACIAADVPSTYSFIGTTKPLLYTTELLIFHIYFNILLLSIVSYSQFKHTVKTVVLETIIMYTYWINNCNKNQIMRAWFTLATYSMRYHIKIPFCALLPIPITLFCHTPRTPLFPRISSIVYSQIKIW